MTELNDYIDSVLQKGEHGPCRLIEFDLKTLNDVIDRHAQAIAHHVHPTWKEGLHLLHLRKKVTVHNYLGNIQFECIPVSPSNLDELVDVFVKAKNEKQNIRAVGAFHAWSPLCVTSGYLVKTDKLVGTQRTPTAALKDPANAIAYYDLLSGTSWKEAALALEKEGRALMNIGGYSGLHVAGATSTGTHGSGLTIPPLAGMIRGLTVVSAKFGADGKPIVYKIEPTNGITDPKRHPGPDVLLQDDKTFSAAIVGLCALGVIYSLTIETVPFYYIVESRQLTDWNTAKAILAQGPTGDILKYHNAEVWMNAYTKKALITRREVTMDPPKDEYKSISAFQTLIEKLPALKKVLAELQAAAEEVLDDIVFLLGQVLALILRAFPLIIPFGVNLALDTQNHDKPKVGKYYDIYDIGFANFFPAISIEIAYPMSNYIAGTEAALDSVNKLRDEDISKALAGFFSLRFTSGFSANLSMSYTPDPAKSAGRCYLEIFSLFAVFPTIQDFDTVVGPLQKDSIQNFQGRLHWGQYLTPSFTANLYKDRDPEFYDSISAFKSIAVTFDPDKMMRNDFMDQVVWSGIEVPVKRAKKGPKWLQRLKGWISQKTKRKAKNTSKGEGKDKAPAVTSTP